MDKVLAHTEVVEKTYVIDEERGFYSRAHADHVVGLWAAARLGMAEDEAERYAQDVVDAGVRSRDGRGGFDFIRARLGEIGVHIEELRTRYAIASDNAPPVMAVMAAMSGAARR